MLQFDWFLQRPISTQAVYMTSSAFKVVLVVTRTSFGEVSLPAQQQRRHVFPSAASVCLALPHAYGVDRHSLSA